MPKISDSKKDKKRAVKGVIACCVVMLIGYYVLNHISTLEDPPLGNTISMLIGLTFIATGGVGIVMIIKYLIDKKIKKKRRELKRRKHKVVFLKKETNDNKN